MKEPALLYVEDNLDDRVLFDMACKQADAQFRLFSVEHGKEAVDYLSGSGRYANRSEFPLPDGVLLDLKMPFLDGFGVLRWIRGHNSFAGLPVFVFSSSYQEADIQRAYEQQATAFLTKPAEFKALTHLASTLYRCFSHGHIHIGPIKSLPQFKRPLVIPR